MEHAVTIRMMGEYIVTVEGREDISLPHISRKGADFLEYLVLCQGKSAPKQRLLNMFWPQYRHDNPENAMKTLISRLRKALNEIEDGLGACILSERGAYRFQPVDGLTVDLWELMQLFEEFPKEAEENKKLEVYAVIRSMYRGDLYLSGELEGGEGYATALRNSYKAAVYGEVEILKKREEYNRIASICREALAVDGFDDRLNMELMEALAIVNRTQDALDHYTHAADMNRKYLDAAPSPEMKSLRSRLLRNQNTLNYNLDFVRNELQESEKQRGAFVCEYTIFREIFNLQVCNLDRLGATLFLGLLLITGPDETSKIEENTTRWTDALIEILRSHLRRGDIVTKFAPNVCAVLLPTVNYVTGNLVMERIHQIFTSKFTEENVTFQYRLREMGHGKRQF